MAAYGCRPPKSLFAGLGCGLGYMRSLSVMHSTTEVAYADCYVVAKPLHLPFFTGREQFLTGNLSQTSQSILTKFVVCT